MTGFDKAKSVADKIKNDVGKNQENKTRELAEVRSRLATVQQDPELVKMYQESAEIGAGNLAGELPLLKIYSAGRSVAELADGSEPKNGSYFYKPLQKEYLTIDCHILTISHGFRAEGMMNSKTGKRDEPKFNQIMGGAIIDGAELYPFIMYFTGKKLPKLWEFGKEASKYTKMKPVPIPMFALMIRMGTEQVTSDYGKVWVPTFEIVKNDDETPVVVSDTVLFQYLKEKAVGVEETISSLIDSKSVVDDEEKVQKIDGTVEESIPF